MENFEKILDIITMEINEDLTKYFGKRESSKNFTVSYKKYYPYEDSRLDTAFVFSFVQNDENRKTEDSVFGIIHSETGE